MILGVPKEIAPGETRVAIVPESVARLAKLGFEVHVESNAGKAAGFLNEQYEAEGAKIVADVAEVFGSADVLVKVQRPIDHPSGKNELDMMKKGALSISFFFPLNYPEETKRAAGLGLNIMSMDQIPRTTLAQRMDALSSQTNLGGYKAVLIAANALKKIFPLMMTAAGTISPAKVVVIGAGVAGLQAIATAKRLGAVVEVSDVRSEVKEQVQSLGGKYIEPPESESADGEGGYAKEQSAEFLAKQQELLAQHISEADVVVTTAQVPGKKAPMIVSKAMVDRMRPGSVVVDMAAEQGGNCEYTQANETIDVNGVSVIGAVNLPATLPFHASQLYSRNLLALLQYITKEGALNLDLSDEIVAGSLITKGGEVVHERTKELL